MDIERAPDATANLSSLGDHRTNVAARLILSKTKVGFHLFVAASSFHTYALRSWEHVTFFKKI